MPLPRRFRLACSVVAGVASLAGCYRHVPAAPAPLAAGVTVRLFLTADGTTQLAPRLGPQTLVVDGRVESATATDATLVVSQTTKALGDRVAWAGERVTIPNAVVARAEVRAFDRKRTIVTAAVAAAAAIAGFIVLIAQAGGGSGDEGGGGIISP